MSPERDTTAIYAPAPEPGFVEWRPGTLAGAAFDVVTIMAAVGYALMAIDLGVGDASQPGAGFFPVVAAVLVIVCLGLDLIRRVIMIARGQSEKGSGRVSWQVLGILGLIAFYFIALPVIGHLLASFVLFAGMLFLLSTRRWWKILLISAVAAGLSDLVFTALLGLHLPTGLFNFGWAAWI